MPGELLTVADQSITSRKVDLTYANADVLTSQTTTSTSFTNLATTGPTITMSPGVTQDHLVILRANVTNDTSGGAAVVAPSIGGVTVVEADRAYVAPEQSTGEVSVTISTHVIAPAQVNGAIHQFKARVSAGTGTFSDRRITGLAI